MAVSKRYIRISMADFWQKKPSASKALTEQGIHFIDLVVVNLYPFKETILKPAISEAEAIEMIDIGGPSMLRSAAKIIKT